MTADGATNVALAHKSWGAAAPEWVIVLAETADRTTQTSIAKRLGVSPTVINQALRNTYPSPLTKLEQKVRGELMGQMVDCPVLGEITTRKCIDTQGRPYAATNALRVELRRACPRCPNSAANKEAS